MDFELSKETIEDKNGDVITNIHAVSLDTINGYYHFLIISNDVVTSHGKRTKRPTVSGLNYEHACLSIVDENVSFSSLPYRPSAYPSASICDMEAFSFDDGQEIKIWAIKEIDDKTAHVFYENNHTDGRLVHQYVDLSVQPIAHRIKHKLTEGYQVLQDKYDFKVASRSLICIK
jgi:hypothetical protein